ncbi:Ger(x)C family spore germination protein [Desulfosporosinus fructosivorans]|uniref:Ger(x)C family spore germination protein n=1 Tax=Desulfosporosinus fructosivorans TaxID=2018669 RepID=UPI00130E9951|nr:Ger(x)C family spore germination protein [Desulfosporosinus fructosivorans]
MRSKIILALLLSLTVFFIVGCWDVQEINRRVSTNALFFDVDSTGKIRMGTVFSVPGTLLPPVIGTQQQFEKRNYLITAEDTSITDAWSKLQAKSERDIFFGQLRAIVLTENAARGDINNLLDFIGRIPSVPPNTVVLVTKDDPKELLDMKNESNNIPGNYIDLFFQTPTKETLAIPIDLWRVLAQMDNKTSDPHLPLIKASEGSYDISGTALFSDNHLVGELDLEETKTLALLKGSSSGYLTVPLKNGEYVAFKDVKAKSVITPKLDDNGKVAFGITTKVTGVIVETNPRKMELTEEDKRIISSHAEMEIQNKIGNLFIKLQSLNSDAVGLGEKFRVKYPGEWQKENWRQIYPNCLINMETRFIIARTGLFR